MRFVNTSKYRIFFNEKPRAAMIFLINSSIIFCLQFAPEDFSSIWLPWTTSLHILINIWLYWLSSRSNDVSIFNLLPTIRKKAKITTCLALAINLYRGYLVPFLEGDLRNGKIIINGWSNHENQMVIELVPWLMDPK